MVVKNRKVIINDKLFIKLPSQISFFRVDILKLDQATPCGSYFRRNISSIMTHLVFALSEAYHIFNGRGH